MGARERSSVPDRAPSPTRGTEYALALRDEREEAAGIVDQDLPERALADAGFTQHRTKDRRRLSDAGPAVLLQRPPGREIRRQEQTIHVSGLQKRQNRRHLLRVRDDWQRHAI